MKFIQVTNNWYVRDAMIRDIWLSNNNTQLNIGYAISGMTPDHITCDNEKEAKATLERLIKQLNQEQSLED